MFFLAASASRRGNRLGIPPIVEHQTLRTLPLFPLPLVLFPGTVLPLHIFEERYKLMIQTCLETDKQFGVVLLDPDTQPESEESSRIGCIAEIMLVVPAEDGKMNILTTGKTRFSVERLLRDKEYLIGEVREFHDDLDLPATLEGDARRVRKLFDELVALAVDLSDSPLAEGTVPEEAQALSFAVSSAVPMENSVKQLLLEMTSTSLRLRELQRILTSLIDTYRRRKFAKKAAEGNGHGGKIRL